MTVRADLVGRYSNRMYAYEPADLKIREYSVSQPNEAHHKWKTYYLINCLSSVHFPSPVLENMGKAKKLLKTEL